MGTNCPPLVVDVFLFCYESDFIMSLSDDKQADIIDAFNVTSRYLDEISNINNVYFHNMKSNIPCRNFNPIKPIPQIHTEASLFGFAFYHF